MKLRLLLTGNGDYQAASRLQPNSVEARDVNYETEVWVGFKRPSASMLQACSSLRSLDVHCTPMIHAVADMRTTRPSDVPIFL